MEERTVAATSIQRAWLGNCYQKNLDRVCDTHLGGELELLDKINQVTADFVADQQANGRNKIAEFIQRHNPVMKDKEMIPYYVENFVNEFFGSKKATVPSKEDVKDRLDEIIQTLTGTTATENLLKGGIHADRFLNTLVHIRSFLNDQPSDLTVEQIDRFEYLKDVFEKDH